LFLGGRRRAEQTSQVGEEFEVGVRSHRVYRAFVELRDMVVQKSRRVDDARVQKVGQRRRDRVAEIIRHRARVQLRCGGEDFVGVREELGRVCVRVV
jgi:hypothetical protein